MGDRVRTATVKATTQAGARERAPARQCEHGHHVVSGATCDRCASSASPLQPAGIPTLPQPIHAAVQQALTTPGFPLDGGTRRFMEQRIGSDFSGIPARLSARRPPSIAAVDDPLERAADLAAERALDSRRNSPAFAADFGRVRLHVGPLAEAAARLVRARAFTIGDHIFFAEGQYRPTGLEGRRLLAHELAHVAQQAGGGMLLRKQLPGDDPIPVGSSDIDAKDEDEQGIQQPGAQTPTPAPAATGAAAESQAPSSGGPSPAHKGVGQPAAPPGVDAAGPSATAQATDKTPQTPGELPTGDLALIDTELAEHERWGAAAAKVGTAGSAQRAKFVAESAGTGAAEGFKEGALQGAKMAIEMKIAEKLVEKVAVGIAVRLGAQAAKFTPLPGVGAVIGGVLAGIDLAKRDWGVTGKAIAGFGKGADIYEQLANTIESISTVLEVATQVANVIAGILGLITVIMWAVSVATVGVTSPLAATLTTISLAIGLGTMVLDGINALVLKELITTFRALHAFASDADPRDVVAQGKAIETAAGGATGFVGGLVGAKAGEKGMHFAGKKVLPKLQGHPKPPAATGEGPAIKAEPPKAAEAKAPAEGGGPTAGTTPAETTGAAPAAAEPVKPTPLEQAGPHAPPEQAGSPAATAPAAEITTAPVKSAAPVEPPSAAPSVPTVEGAAELAAPGAAPKELEVKAVPKEGALATPEKSSGSQERGAAAKTAAAPETATPQTAETPGATPETPAEARKPAAVTEKPTKATAAEPPIQEPSGAKPPPEEPAQVRQEPVNDPRDVAEFEARQAAFEAGKRLETGQVKATSGGRELVPPTGKALKRLTGNSERAKKLRLKYATKQGSEAGKSLLSNVRERSQSRHFGEASQRLVPEIGFRKKKIISVGVEPGGQPKGARTADLGITKKPIAPEKWNELKGQRGADVLQEARDLKLGGGKIADKPGFKRQAGLPGQELTPFTPGLKPRKFLPEPAAGVPEATRSSATAPVGSASAPTAQPGKPSGSASLEGAKPTLGETTPSRAKAIEPAAAVKPEPVPTAKQPPAPSAEGAKQPPTAPGEGGGTGARKSRFSSAEIQRERLETIAERRRMGGVRSLVEPEFQGIREQQPQALRRGESELLGRSEVSPRVKKSLRAEARERFGQQIQEALNDEGKHTPLTQETLKHLRPDQVEAVRRTGRMPEGFEFHHLATIADYPEFGHLAESGLSLPKEVHRQAGHGGDATRPVEAGTYIDPEATERPGFSIDPQARKHNRAKARDIVEGRAASSEKQGGLNRDLDLGAEAKLDELEQRVQEAEEQERRSPTPENQAQTRAARAQAARWAQATADLRAQFGAGQRQTPPTSSTPTAATPTAATPTAATPTAATPTAATPTAATPAAATPTAATPTAATPTAATPTAATPTAATPTAATPTAATPTAATPAAAAPAAATPTTTEHPTSATVAPGAAPAEPASNSTADTAIAAVSDIEGAGLDVSSAGPEPTSATPSPGAVSQTPATTSQPPKASKPTTSPTKQAATSGTTTALAADALEGDRSVAVDPNAPAGAARELPALHPKLPPQATGDTSPAPGEPATPPVARTTADASAPTSESTTLEFQTPKSPTAESPTPGSKTPGSPTALAPGQPATPTTGPKAQTLPASEASLSSPATQPGAGPGVTPAQSQPPSPAQPAPETPSGAAAQAPSTVPASGGGAPPGTASQATTQQTSPVPPAATVRGAPGQQQQAAQGDGDIQSDAPIVERVSPRYPNPPGTPDDLVSLRNQIIDTLAARAQTEQFADKMAEQQKHHEANQKPLESLKKGNEESISATQAHQQAIANRDEANQRKQESEGKARSKIDDYSSRAGQLTSLTVPLKGLSKFTGLASSLPEEPNVVGSFKRKVLKVNSDSNRFLAQMDQMDQTMAGQKGQHEERDKGIKADADTLKDTNTRADRSAEAFAAAKETTEDFDKENQDRIKESSEQKAAARQSTAKLETQARQKQSQAVSLAAAMQFWAQSHQQARRDALEQTRVRLEAIGYRVTEVRER